VLTRSGIGSPPRPGVSIGTRSGGEVIVGTGPSATALGVGRHAASDRVWIGFVPLLGRIDAHTLGALADLADQVSSGDLRVSPWRGVLLADVRTDDVAGVAAAGERLGLNSDPADPARLVVACAGSRGCAAGMTDTQADARELVDQLRGRAGTRAPVSFHVSGCAKGCAAPAGAEVSLIAEADGVYGVFTGRGIHDASPFGVRVGAELAPAAAIAVALTETSQAELP